MKRKLHEIWKAQEGSKIVWKIQAPKGIITFDRKRDAIKWVEFTGKDVNDEFELTGDNKFQDDLHFLAFNLDNLNIGKLAMFKLKMQDRWFDDIIDNTLYFENRGEVNE